MDAHFKPNYRFVEKNEDKQLKWRVPTREHQFFYQFNQKFKAKVDLDIAREGGDQQKRKLALRKLYFEYKNQ